MKTFAVFLVCLFAAVQSRSAGVEVLSEAALGENPWVVHLRVAHSTSGRLRSCVGTLINDRWVLTSATCIRDSRFIWIRYGAVNVVNPELVTETNVVRVHPGYSAFSGDNDIALVSINRFVESTDNVSPVQLAGSDGADLSSGRFCGYGANEDNSAGEKLSCFDVAVEESEDGNWVATSGDGAVTQFDLGAPLVSDGVQYGLLVRYPRDGDNSAGVFLNVANYVDWINAEVNFSNDFVNDSGNEVQVADLTF